ncbi:hypothetical protein EHS25_004261 [Saitozyma podzolica]|uniref:Uncharacterized protein n=1 Tax=Saitozyma podzolica TaxID=1890683 RepID=A0A427YTI5_9TREE|nr:hypothetical protein EHS25_004261 [Saitozyma podzolica]
MLLSVASSSRAAIRPNAARTSAVALRSNSSSPPSSSSSPPSPTRPRRRRAASDLPIENVDLVGPPDPISNIRPVIYASTPSRRRTPNSPYSTGEFPAESTRLEELELEWRLRQQRVDAMNHRFWASTNTSFNAQLQHRLSLLPPPSDPPTPQDIQRKEECLSQFYADWQAANRGRMGRWVREWWREVWAGLRMQGKIYVVRVLGR